MNTALKKINARVKVLQKKHPNSKRKTLQKQAGAEWRAGKLKHGVGSVRKKHAVKKKTVAKKRRRAKKPTVKVIRVYRKHHVAKVPTKRRRRARYKVTHKVRRVSGPGKKSILPVVLGLAALAGVAYLVLKPSQPALLPSNNPARVQAQSNILQWAAAAGLVGSALTSIIKALNNSDDTTVINAGTSPNAAQAFLNSQMGD